MTVAASIVLTVFSGDPYSSLISSGANPAKPESMGLTQAQATVDVSAIQQELEDSQRDWFGQRLQCSVNHI